MKGFLLRKMKITPYAMALLFFVSFNTINAQCPTLPVSTQVICDAAGFDFNDLNAFATPAPGNSVRWYLNATGGTPLQQSQLVRQGTYYAGDPTGTCGTRPALLVDFTVDPSGQSLDGIFCSNENPTIQTYIDNGLIINAPAGGSVQVYADFALTNLVNPATALSGNTNYFIVFVDSGGCRSQIETGSTAVFPSPVPPTPPATQQFCSDTNPTIIDLIPGTTANFNWFENVDVSNNPIPPALLDTVALIDGATYYVQADNFFCDSDPVAVVVQINDPVDAGISNSLEYCEDNIPVADFDLLPLLGPNADAGGAWTGPLATSNGDQGTVNISGQVIGVYNFVYTVSGVGVCPDETATVSIEVLEILSSGLPSAINPVSFCVSQLPTAYDLTLLLDNEDIGGTWTQGTTSMDPTVTSPLDLSSFIPGTYDFTYSQNLTPNPCPEESTTVQVIVLADPNAGTAVVTEFCENDLSVNSPYDLFSSLDGSQDNNLGTWTDAMNNTVSNSIDITPFTVAGSPYNYTYTIDNGSCQDSETIVIEILPAPESGNYIGTPFTVCEDQSAANSPYDLFNLLDGTQDTNGTWYAGNTSAGTAVTNPIDLTTLANGTFDFTYAVPAIGTCTDVDVVVTVIINELPNTGTPTPFLVCESELAANSPLDLFGQLSGQDAGGTWSDDDATGALTGNTVDLTGLIVGGYNFSYSITDANGCMNSSTVLVTVAPAPESGAYTGTPFTVCEDQSAANSPYDLFNLLDGTQDTNGTWYAGNTSAGTSVTNPIDLTTLANGTFDFTYAVPAIGTCTDVDVVVSVIINELPNTGTPTPFLVCEDELAANSPLDLFGQLSGQDAGGTWSDDDATGALTGNTVDLTGLIVGTYNFSYTITDGNTCTNSSTVAVTVAPAPESGNYIGTPFTVCEDQAAANSPYDLFNLLDGTQDTNGTWYAGNTSAGTAVANPIDLTTLANGTFDFTYAVPAIGTCTDVDVVVTVIINELPNTGTPTPFLVCENELAANSPLDLFGQLSGQDAGGTWSDDDTTGALTGNTVDLTGLIVGTYNFSYTITDGNTCTNSSTVAVTVAPAPESGNYIGTPFTVCEDQAAANSPYDLFNLLDGTQDTNGTWYAGNTSAGTAVTNPIDLTTLANGTFDFTYAVPAIGTCTDVDVVVTVIINELPNTGTPTPFVVCENELAANSPLALFGQLSGQDAGGTWSDDDATGALTGNTVDLTGLIVGTYNFSYTITDGNTCTNSSTVAVTVAPAPESGNYIGTPFTVCEDQAAANSPYDLFNLLDGTQDTNGTWYAGNTSAGTAVSNPIDLTTLTNGTFDFTYAVPAIGTCTDVDVTVTIIINALTEAGTATTFVVCANELAANSPLDLFGQLSGQDAGGTWSDDDATGALTGNNVDLTGFVVGGYNFTYTVTNGSCSDTATVLVSVLDAPNAGTSTDLDICLSDIATGQTLDLFTQLTGNDAGGNWSDDDLTGELTGSILNISALTAGVYNFTYSVSPSTTCSADMETVQITINNINAPTAPAIQDFCDQATVADLSAIGNAVIWYEDAALMNPLIGTDALLDGEDYFATQTDAITNCESNDSVAVTVNIFASPNSGVAVLLSVCNDQSMVDLFTALDGTQDAGGTWIDTDATMALTGNIFDSTAVVAGTYSFEYMVSATAPCTDASTIVMVTVETPVDAGTDAVLDACTDNGTTDLFTLLGTATTGGTWSPALASNSGVFDPATDLAATYSYTVTSSCNTSSADVVVTITEAPDAGTDNMISTCVSDGIIDLLTQLGGTPDATGTWFPLLDSGTNIFDPTVDVAGMYTYTVTATSPCATDASATLDIQVDESAAPILISATLDFCATDNPTVMDLDAAVTGDMIVWYDAIDASIPLAAAESLIDGTSYFASQTEANGCESSIRTEVMVTVGDAPTPTLNQGGELFCINDNPTLQQLTLNVLEYDSIANNVVWYDTVDGTNALPLTTIMTSGTTYYAALIDAATGCESNIRLEVTVDLSACGDLTIPDGFSPNGDGVNDTFDIDNLNFLYPNFGIEFYNRYGGRVYNGTANTPRFNGFSNQSALLSDGELPVGVYYYILKYNDGTTKPSQGRIYLSR
jgi:gliding motility-associated-like protein